MFKNLLNRILSPVPVPSPPLAPDDVDGADALIAGGNAREDGGGAAQAEALFRRAGALAPG
ncbi:MAG: hypothetical protein H7276_18385, partial [Caulobacter sp.]|nr:hypothetical protein [Vitreoscilla sp.]